MSAARGAAAAQRLEASAKVLAYVLDARGRDQRAAAMAALARVSAAYQKLRRRRRVSSFICAAFAEFWRGGAARAAAFESNALQAFAAAERVRGERRHWGALARGLQRRARRMGRVRSCRD